jgi:hypothetical protein
MCLKDMDFKQPEDAGTANCGLSGNDSSIIPAKLLSIMPAGTEQVTFD